MSATPRVLAFSVRGDLVLDRVSNALKDLGAELVPFYTDDFPAGATLEYHAGFDDDIVLESAGGRVALTEVHSIWLRRLDVAATLPSTMEERYRTAARKESLAAVNGAIAAFTGPVVDRMHLLQGAADKPRQLRAAQRLGLRVPATVITNSPGAARAFAAEHGPLIAKPLRPITIVEDDHELGMYASQVTDEHLSELESLRWCPLVFQAAIPKALEIRATVVGDTVLAAAVDSQSSEHGRTDWRRGTAELASSWAPHDLPESISTRLVALVKEFGLNYSAADLILTPTGDYVFLESNPAGEWGWIQEGTGLDVAGALAAQLLEPA